jgi:hypothetical protein
VRSASMRAPTLFASPPWSERLAARVAAVHDHVAALATEAKARRDIDAAVDVALLGASFFSFYYFALLAFAQGGHPDPARIFRRMLARHFEGLRPGARRSRTRRTR